MKDGLTASGADNINEQFDLLSDNEPYCIKCKFVGYITAPTNCIGYTMRFILNPEAIPTANSTLKGQPRRE
jgi:hypothetical protein